LIVPREAAILHAVAWSVLTIALYLAAKRVYRRWPRWWLMPLAVTPVLLLAIVLAVHSS